MDKKKFIEEIMDSGVWEDKSCSKKERQNAIQLANKLYEVHFAELIEENNKLRYCIENGLGECNI